MCRSSSTLLVLASLCLTSIAFAQRRPGQTQQSATEIHVYVRYANEQKAGPQLMVELTTNGGAHVAQGFTNSEGQAILTVTAVGTFRVRVSGTEIETAVSDQVEITGQDHMEMVNVQVQSKPGIGQSTSSNNKGMASANQLRIPAAARKPFDKGIDAMQHKDFPKAAGLFQKAIDEYPQYDAAYDLLGVALMQMGQTDKGGEAFEHAVQLNDKNPNANRNYARYLIGKKEYSKAEEALKRSLMASPQDPSALTLIAMAEFQTKDYDAALQNALRVHQGSHEGYALAHYIAARVYALKHQNADAAAEYKTYLKETPNGPQAEQVRAALAELASSSNAPQPSASSPQ